ncbi:hypothetical protein A5886_000388 [Enterococcus sp. 8G7_MSG3316]|uniref:HTH cro/C1-type domain-containing protein n=1 Tax=Candidatus Enterococcus testudinis TaxID=1834191 RepID=A0A242A2Q2_9ENTE|nr:helix-turn-helix transcriptional regulator [Enterococcus sp. 8G7_MSG3316]OTN75318.1 hypothetical protein A5886_000388 [Enterococcus sp. 8G7_MSG3316]
MFSDRLKELRKKQGISQAVLADYLSISRQAISRYENGSAEPDLKNAVRIATYFQVSVDELLGTAQDIAPDQTTLHRIFVISKITGSLSSYYKFILSPVFSAKADEPAVMLMGIDAHSFWGDHQVPLAFYRTKAAAEKEINALYQALADAQRTYDLHFYVSTTKKGRFGIQMIKELP